MKSRKKIFQTLLCLAISMGMTVQTIAPIYAEETNQMEEQENIEEQTSQDDLNQEENSKEEVSEETLPEQVNTQNEAFDQDNDSADSISDTNVNPNTLSQAIKGLTDAYKALGGSSDSITSLAGIMGRIGGGAAALSGGVAILQMIGIFKDPTTVKLENIMNVLDQHTKSLQEMNNKLNDLASQLQQLSAQGTVHTRALLASQYTKDYNDYNTHYIEELERKISIYKGWVLKGIQNWAEGNTYENTYVYYKVSNGQKEQTYSRKKNMDLDISDEGCTISKEYTISLYAEDIQKAMNGYTEEEWNVDAFRDAIENRLQKQIIESANNNKLGCSQSFKEEWKSYSEEEKTNKAKEIAQDMLNSVLYKVSCDAVNEHTDVISELVTFMSQTWKNTLKNDNGISCLIRSYKNTYCFEGQVSEQLNQIYNEFELIMSVYSAFVMTLASQNTIIMQSDKSSLQNQWVNGTITIDNMKNTTFHGNNFCYLTNTLIQSRKLKVQGVSTIQSKYYERSYGFEDVEYLRAESHSSEKWKLYDEANNEVNDLHIIDGENLQALYMTWSNNPSGKTFTEFLNKNQALSQYENFTNKICTNYKGAQDFALTDGIEMKCFGAFYGRNPSYFEIGNNYTVMTDKSRMSHTVLHDKVVADLFNLTTGSEEMYSTIAARAQYFEAHSYWFVDEPWYFGATWMNNECESSGSPGETMTYTFTSSTDIYVLESVVPSQSDITFDEGIFDPNEVDEEIKTNTIDTTYTSHKEETRTMKDWKAENFNSLFVIESEKELKEVTTNYLNSLISKAKEEGKNISLSTSEKEKLIQQMNQMIQEAKSQIQENENLGVETYLDPFGIYGNTKSMTALAKAVLPDSEIAYNGDLMDKVENMITAYTVEPYVYVNFEKSGNSYQPKLIMMYEINPKLLVYCEQSDSYTAYDISEDVMKKLGLTMTIRLNADDAQTNTKAVVKHYDDFDTMNLEETFKPTVQGQGTNRYVEISVSQCSPFSVEYLNSTKNSSNTGISTNGMQYILLTMISLFVLAWIGMSQHKKYKEKKEI